MRATGITRRLDCLGRIVIPREIVKNMDLEKHTPLEFFIDGDTIILKKYIAKDACRVTGVISADNVSLADGKLTVSQDIAQIIKKELSEEHKNE